MPAGDQAWAFGLAMTSVLQCVGYSSGGHINPAVTGAFVFTGKITWLRALAYVIAQVTGGRQSTISAWVNKGKYLPNMNKFCDWLSETKVISAHDSFF